MANADAVQCKECENYKIPLVLWVLVFIPKKITNFFGEILVTAFKLQRNEPTKTKYNF